MQMIAITINTSSPYVLHVSLIGIINNIDIREIKNNN